MKDKWTRFEFRKARVRDRLRDAASSRPRLSVRRSLRYIYAQVVDDSQGKTLAFASSLSPELRGKLKSAKSVEAAKGVGQLVAEKALKAGVKRVAFDRGGYLYHGRVRALADAARAAGLEF